jgi:hypothetical protein
MALNLEAVLGSRNLIGLIQSVVGSVPDNLLPKGLMKSDRSCEGNRGTYLKVRGTRQTARLVAYGSASKARELPGVSEVPVTLLHSFEHCIHPAAILQNLLAEEQNDPNAEVKQKMGLQTVSRQIQQFGQLFVNLRISAIYSALALGKIYFDSDGNLLPTSASAAQTIDYGIPAANIGKASSVLSGLVDDTGGWDTATTDIQAQMIELKVLARQRTGYELTHAFYGKSVLGYLAKNNMVKQVMTGSSRYAESAMLTEIPDGTFGIKKWYPVSEAFFAKSTIPLGSDETANVAEWFPADQITFTPDPSPEWWEMLEGTYPVPQAFNITGDAMEQLRALKQAVGAFSYATMQDDPVSVKHLGGDTFLPIIKVPGAVFQFRTKA